MIHILMMLVMAGAMVLFREPLGGGLVRLVERARPVLLLALTILVVWALMQDPVLRAFAPMSEMTVFVGDLIAYADLVLGMTLVALNRQVRQAARRAAGVAWSGGRTIVRLAGRARRTRSATRPGHKRPSDEPEPSWAFA